MKPHKWAKEIKAWADGAEIEYRHTDDNWYAMKNPSWNNEYLEYRIKSTPKEPQYLYVYNDGGYSLISFVRDNSTNYIGKIKLENEDES
jgi:hypothetical protein